MGQAGPDAVILVQSAAEAAALPIDEDEPYGLVTQTTLSVTEAERITRVLRDRIPWLHEPPRSDVCYATTNRQAALRAITHRCEAVVVIGGSNSSNSRRLVEIARNAGCPNAMLISRAAELDLSSLNGISTLGATSGASTPEKLMREFLDYLARHFTLNIEEIVVNTETMHFNLPHFPD